MTSFGFFCKVFQVKAPWLRAFRAGSFPRKWSSTIKIAKAHLALPACADRGTDFSVAGVDLPVDRHAARLPGAQRVAAGGSTLITSAP